MGKHCNDSQCFKEKNYKAKFLISSIFKKQSTEIILEKKITKQTPKKGKKIMLETLQQFIVFCDESYSASPHDLALFVMTCNCNSQPPQYEKNKIDKDNFGKNHKKKQIMWRDTISIHSVL